jgi:hypothetical protein
MALLDLQGLRLQDAGIGLESNLSESCVPESNISMAFCDDDPDYSDLSVILCAGAR